MRATMLLLGSVVVGCVDESDPVLAAIGAYHAQAYEVVSVTDIGETVVLGAADGLVGEASLWVDGGPDGTRVVADYASAGLDEAARWSGDSVWFMANETEHDLSGTLEVDGVEDGLSLSLWSELGDDTVDWYAGGSLGDRVLADTLVHQVPVSEDSEAD